MKLAAYIDVVDNKKSLLYLLLNKIAQTNKQTACHYFTKTWGSELLENEEIIFLSSNVSNKLSKYYFFNYKLPTLLKKYPCDIFFSENEQVFYKKISTPFLFFSAIGFLKKNNTAMSNKILQASHIFTTEEFMREKLITKFNLSPKAITTIYYGLQNKSVINSKSVSKTPKELYTAGYDYFLCIVDKQSPIFLIELLKAFSQFKKWQKSSIKLMLLFEGISTEDAIKDFTNYKYKDEVVIISTIGANTEQIISSAFAFIFFGDYRPNSSCMFALQNNVPIIIEDKDDNQSLFKQAAIFALPTNKSLSEKMQLIYKDESTRKNLAMQAQEVLQQYNINAAANFVNAIISKHKI
jgi:hypothetical protein